MPAQASEAFIFRTYPFKEGDLIVSFFTRDQGKLRGVARRARKPKSSFGSGLERLSRVTMSYYQRENRELVNLNSCDVLDSQFALAGEYAANLALDYMAEVSENILPPAEPSERFFRLLMAVLDYLHRNPAGGVWPAINLFQSLGCAPFRYPAGAAVDPRIKVDRRRNDANADRAVDRTFMDAQHGRRICGASSFEASKSMSSAVCRLPTFGGPLKGPQNTRAVHHGLIPANPFQAEELLVRARLHHSGAV